MISAPYIRSSVTRSLDTFSGITQTSRYPRSLATMARLMPVLPLVGSKIVSPGRNRPSASAARTIHSAARSLTLPVGLRSSSLAHSRTSAEGDSLGSPTRGVPPVASRRLSNRATASLVWGGECREGGEPERAAGHGGQDRHVVAVGQLGVQRAEEADVLVVDVHVDEPVQRPVLDEPVAQPGVPGVQVGEQVGEGVTGAGDGLLAARVLPQDSGDANLDCHGVLLL